MIHKPAATLPISVENSLWKRQVRSQLWDEPYDQDADPAEEPQPHWSFDRFGQSVTELPDGRIFYIGGEYEDFYMPDFQIYNDLVIVYPDRRIELYVYPSPIFPPTDFHTATRIDDKIYLIGNLGYDGYRSERSTPVFCLDSSTLELQRVATHGSAPGWIHEHQAVAKEDGTIHVSKGKLWQAARRSGRENINEWQLDPTTGQWVQLTDNRWLCWRFQRSDCSCNHLWMIRIAWRETGKNGNMENLKWSQDHLLRDLGFLPDVSLVPHLYSPPVSHERLSRAEEKTIGYRGVRIHGVLVRYAEASGSVTMTIEGELSETIQQALVADLQKKLSTLEHIPWTVEPIDLSSSRR